MTALDLLFKIMEYDLYWNSYDFKECEPARIRFLQIRSLAGAFDLLEQKHKINKTLFQNIKDKLTAKPAKKEITPTEIEQILGYIVRGRFIHNPTGKMDPILVQEVLTFVKEYFPGREDRDMIQADFSMLFNNLFFYRKKIFEITRKPDGILEGFSGGLYYSFHLQAQVNEVIEENIKHIDDVLWRILDAGKRSLTELPADYPVDDLETIERNWLMDNY